MKPLADDVAIARTISQQVPVEALLADIRDTGNFADLIRRSMTEDEADSLATLWDRVWSEIPDGAAARVRAALADLKWIVDAELLKFIRANSRPPLVRGDIAAVTKRVDSMAAKAAQIAHDVATLSAALHDMTADGINIIAAGADIAAQDVADTINGLQGQLRKLAEARDAVLKESGRRTNEARASLAAAVVSIWQDRGLGTTGDDRDALEGFLAGAVEAVEAVDGAIGKGQREWLRLLVDTALAAPKPE